MVFAVVPDDVTIEEITGPEKKALDEYMGGERKENYLSQFLGNENTPIVIGGFIAGFLGVRLAESIISDLETRVGKLSEDVKQGIKDSVDIRLPTFGAPAPVAPKLSDLITYIKEEISK